MNHNRTRTCLHVVVLSNKSAPTHGRSFRERVPHVGTGTNRFLVAPSSARLPSAPWRYSPRPTSMSICVCFDRFAFCDRLNSLVGFQVSASSRVLRFILPFFLEGVVRILRNSEFKHLITQIRQNSDYKKKQSSQSYVISGRTPQSFLLRVSFCLSSRDPVRSDRIDDRELGATLR